MPNPFLACLVVIEGFVTISCEILTIRQLMPVVGNSVMVTSLIIGFFLLFLALGYLRGGQIKSDFVEVLLRNFILAAIWLGIGLSYSFIHTFFYSLQNLTGQSMLVLIAYLCLITSPMVFWLGQTVPITMNLFQNDSTVGALGGKVLHLSTLGSFLGAVITSLVLLMTLGVAWTVFINFIFLIALCLFLLPKRQLALLRMTFCLMLSVFVFLLNVKMEQDIFLLTNAYGNYSVEDNVKLYERPGKVFKVNNSYSSFQDVEQKGFHYIELIKRILFNDLKLTKENILVLGAGGFSLSSETTQDNHFTYVDIDPTIKELVETHYNKKINGEFIADDARRYLSHTPEKYKAVVTDVYSHVHAIPSHLLTQGFFRSVQQVLEPDGVALFNIIANPTLADKYSRRVDRTLRSVFPDCMSIPVEYQPALTNIIYVCSMPKLVSAETIYTDNQNRVSYDFATTRH